MKLCFMIADLALGLILLLIAGWYMWGYLTGKNEISDGITSILFYQIYLVYKAPTK